MEPRSYVDFQPRTEWFKGREGDTLMVNVSGFKKEQLKVLINTAGNLKISGERPIEGQHWSRFIHSFTIPKNCKLGEIQAKFDGDEGLLYVMLPFSAPFNQLSPPSSSQAKVSTTGTSIHPEAASPSSNNAALKAKEKLGGGEEEEEDKEKINPSYRNQEGTVQSERKYSGASSLQLNKKKLIIVSVSFGVMALLGLAIYLSYRLKRL